MGCHQLFQIPSCMLFSKEAKYTLPQKKTVLYTSERCVYHDEESGTTIPLGGDVVLPTIDYIEMTKTIDQLVDIIKTASPDRLRQFKQDNPRLTIWDTVYSWSCWCGCVSHKNGIEVLSGIRDPEFMKLVCELYIDTDDVIVAIETVGNLASKDSWSSVFTMIKYLSPTVLKDFRVTETFKDCDEHWTILDMVLSSPHDHYYGKMLPIVREIYDYLVVCGCTTSRDLSKYEPSVAIEWQKSYNRENFEQFQKSDEYEEWLSWV